MLKCIRVLSLALTVAAFASADGAHAEDIDVQDAWARASAGKVKTGAAFMTVTNTGQSDRIVGASADVAEAVELHTHVKEGDVMRMRPVDAIEVPATGQVELKPGGLHIMFIGLHQPLVEGQVIPLILNFEKAGKVSVEVDVRKVGAMGSMHESHHGSMKTKTE